MKLKTLLKQLKYFYSDRELFQSQEEGLSSVMKKLKKKEVKLMLQISSEADDEERELLEQELSVVHLQARKGNELLARMWDGEGSEKKLI